MPGRKSQPEESHACPSPHPTVCVVVLNRNGAEDVLGCLKSVFACSYADLRVILVDNASEDDSLDRVRGWAAGDGAIVARQNGQADEPRMLEEIEIDQPGDLEVMGDRWRREPARWPHLTMIGSGTNLGFAGGHNLGIRVALEAGFEFVLLLNSDVTVEAGFLGPLVEAARDPDVGATGPLVAFYSDPERVWQAGARIYLSRGRVAAMGSNSKVADIAGGPREVDALVGCALLLKSAALMQVGLIDTDYFLYLEESDWFVRARKLGWKAVLVPGSKVLHKESALSIQAKSVYSSYYFARNRLYLVKKNRPAYLPLAVAWTLRYGILNNVLKRRWSLLTMTVKGVLDFFAGRVGKCESLEHDLAAAPAFMIFTVDYKPQAGGIAEHTHKIALHLAQKGVAVTVLAPGRGDYQEFDARQPFETYRVPVLPVVDNLLYFLFAFRLVIRHRIGVVYCATSHPCALICRVLRILIHFRYTVTIHAHEVLYGGRGLRQTLKRGLKPIQIGVIGAADRVFAVSRFTRRALIDSGVVEAKTTVIPNGIDLADLTSAPRDLRVVSELGIEGKPVILTVARLDVHKGHDTVIRALPDVLKHVPDAVYVIAGEGPMRSELERLGAALGVSDHVIFTGYLPRPKILALYEACTVFAMISRIQAGSVEGFGISFLEANAFSKPVVGGRSGGIPDAVEDGRSGLLVDPLNPDEVAGALLRILTDPGLASRLGATGYERVASEFTWEEAVRTVLHTLESP